MSAYTEIEAHKFELLHEVLGQYPGAITAAARRLADMAKKEPSLAQDVWTTQGILKLVESKAYAAWQQDYLAVMGHHATYAAFKALADPARIPKAVAGDVLKDAREGKLKEAARKAAGAASVPKGMAQATSLMDQMGLGPELAAREGK